VAPRPQMICDGILPIDQMRDYMPPVRLACVRLSPDYFFQVARASAPLHPLPHPLPTPPTRPSPLSHNAPKPPSPKEPAAAAEVRTQTGGDPPWATTKTTIL
jgi:hypothetical protein